MNRAAGRLGMGRCSMLVAGGVLAVLAGAGIGAAHPPGPPDERLERDLQALGLAPDQTRRVEGILDAARAERQSIHARIERAYEAMHALLEQDEPDEAAVMRQAEAIGAVKIERRKAMLRTLLRVRAELTAEQRHRLHRMMREKRRHRQADGAARDG